MGTISRGDIFNPDLYLSQDQQDLLAAALATNNPVPRTASNLYKPPTGFMQGNVPLPRTQVGLPQQFRVSPAVPHIQVPPIPQQISPEATSPLDEIGLEGNSGLDFGLDMSFDDGFEYGGTQNEDQLTTGESHAELEHEGDIHDKRKISDEIKAENGGGNKRREGDDKTVKKPGRKPLTSEPTSKRKAQNRAAQRAFRERKEKHLKDLEVKVADLERASESANHENGLLRAQVARLQDDLKEYRKRLTTLRQPASQSPPGSSSFGSRGSNGLDNSNTFQFDFPKFGGLPGSRLFDNASLLKSEQGENKASKAGLSKQASPTEQANPDKQGVTGLYSPSVSANAGGTAASTPGYSHSPNIEARNGSVGNGSMPQLNTGNMSSSASPSASTVSHHGPGSSACTSPETFNNHSPVNGKPMNTPLNSISEEFSEQGITGGALYGQNGSQEKDSTKAVSGIDWLVQQNGGQFDPVLFGDYRESQDAITSGDYGFFNDAFPLYDFSPFPVNNNTATTQQQPGKSIVEQTEERQDAEVEPVPAENTLDRVEVNCNRLWDRIQSNEKYQKGELDIDSLCNDLQMKATCSETGIVFDQQLVDAVLAKFAKDPGSNVVPTSCKFPR
ncbi:MAG: DNA-binding transcription factor yap1 [Peltula sp. TS41687]|nr:MAG: DNA-binding transcription factor yap1 [Peltula sp. TS41687]